MPSYQKKKVYVYLMGKIQENNSIIRAIEVELDQDNTLNDVIDFLFTSSKIKSKSVWGSLRQNGTKLNQCVTIKDMASIIEEQEAQRISLFIYNNDNLRQSSPVKSHRNQPIVFETIPDNQHRVQQLEEIKLLGSTKTGKMTRTQQSTLNQRIQTQNFAQNRPRKISKKQSIKSKSKDQCCLLM